MRQKNKLVCGNFVVVVVVVVVVDAVVFSNYPGMLPAILAFLDFSSPKSLRAIRSASDSTDPNCFTDVVTILSNHDVL